MVTSRYHVSRHLILQTVPHHLYVGASIAAAGAEASIAAPVVERDAKEPTEGIQEKDEEQLKDNIVDCSFHRDVAQSECCVCLDEAKSHAFVPCGHLCVCAGCAESIMSSLKKECPSCRGPAAHVVKIFQ